MPTGFGQHYGEAAGSAENRRQPIKRPPSSAPSSLFGLKQQRSPTPIWVAQKTPFGCRNSGVPDATAGPPLGSAAPAR